MLADFRGMGCLGGVGSLGRGFMRLGPEDGSPLCEPLLATGSCWARADFCVARACVKDGMVESPGEPEERG